MPARDGRDHAVDQPSGREAGLTATAIDARTSFEIGHRVEAEQVEPQEQAAQVRLVRTPYRSMIIAR